MKFKLVHAKDYGVPQNRPRVLLVGKRSDVPGRFFDGEDAVLRLFASANIRLSKH